MLLRILFVNVHQVGLATISIHITHDTQSPARVVQWLDHLDAMCSRAWRVQCAAGSRFNPSRGPV